MVRVLLMLAVATTGLACTEISGRQAETGALGLQAEQLANTPVQMVFLESGAFDESLSRSMRGASPKITVDVPAGFSLNKIPVRVDRWLSSVKQGGGKVVAKPENPPKTRGLAAIVINVVIALIEKMEERQLYQPSQQYHATLLYSDDGTVTKLVFDRR